MPVPVITEQDFEAEVLTSELPVLIEFFAEWSQPSKISAPEVEAAAADLTGRAKVVRMDLERSPRIAQALRIQAVPAYVVFVQGQPATGKPGPLKKRMLLDMIDRYLPRPEGAIRAAELAELLKQGALTPVDTRDASSYQRAHIPGAVSFPLEEVKGRLAELHMLAAPPVFYCRTGGPSKELADELAQEFEQSGFLEGGLLAWEAEQLPIERPD
jgi:thioredoxin-like negative regulator of GroEL